MDERLESALRSGPLPAADLRRALGVSQPTLSRLLAQARQAVVPLGRGRATRYALLRTVRDLPPELPVHRITSEGASVRIGTLLTLRPDRFWYQDLERPERSGASPSLPWFITDMRPQGFLGRLFPQTWSELALPDRVADWTEDQSLYAIARRGEDAAGNLVVGEESLARWITGRNVQPVPWPHRLAAFARRADDALHGHAPGSSAGGEQAKFTIALGDDSSPVRHCIVKFSGPLETAAGRRWADLLLAEHLAALTVAAHGHAAARTEWIEDGRRAYLQVERFDRVGALGRLGLVSLGALDDEFVGERRGWGESAAVLLRQGRIDPDAARELRWLAAFGALVANTDMHLGNASFLVDDRGRLRLAPMYDMLPMAYAPVRDEVPAREVAAPTPRPGNADQWLAALPVAVSFWQALAEDPRASPGFRAIARRHAALLEETHR